MEYLNWIISTILQILPWFFIFCLGGLFGMVRTYVIDIDEDIKVGLRKNKHVKRVNLNTQKKERVL